MKDLRSYGGWALVTGASSGIGAEFARAIAAQRVNCLLVARRQDRLEALAQELNSRHGVECRCIVQDLAADDASGRVVQQVGDTPVGILVNNAGFGAAGRFEARDPARLDEMVRVNCLAPVMLTRALLPPMLERGRGAVILVSSIVGIIPAPYDAVYGATKAFDLSFGQALWGETRDRGLDVITLCPSATKTEFFHATGLPEADAQRMLRMADRPEVLVRRTLRHLGRKPITAPPKTSVPAFFIRFGPRAAVAKGIAASMRRMYRIEPRP